MKHAKIFLRGLLFWAVVLAMLAAVYLLSKHYPWALVGVLAAAFCYSSGKVITAVSQNVVK